MRMSLICSCGNEVRSFEEMPEIPFGLLLAYCNNCGGVVEEDGSAIAKYLDSGVVEKKTTPIEFVFPESV